MGNRKKKSAAVAEATTTDEPVVPEEFGPPVEFVCKSVSSKLLHPDTHEILLHGNRGDVKEAPDGSPLFLLFEAAPGWERVKQSKTRTPTSYRTFTPRASTPT